MFFVVNKSESEDEMMLMLMDNNGKTIGASYRINFLRATVSFYIQPHR